MVTERPDGSAEFRFFRPDAKQVWLTGDFNGWQKHCLPMTRTDDGWWEYRLTLAAGVYQFRYLADGQWYSDYAAFGLERGPFGWNSVLKVAPPRPQPVRPSVRPERVPPADREHEDVLSHALAEHDTDASKSFELAETRSASLTVAGAPAETVTHAAPSSRPRRSPRAPALTG